MCYLSYPGRNLLYTERQGAVSRPQPGAGNLDEAGDTAARVPLVGEELRSPLQDSAGAARTIADAGRDQQEAVTRLAILLGSVVALVPIALGVYLCLPRCPGRDGDREAVAQLAALELRDLGLRPPIASSARDRPRSGATTRA